MNDLVVYVIALAVGVVPTLANHVMDVVALGAGEQMTRVAAWRVVARVQHAQAVRNIAVRQDPSHSVCGNFLPCSDRELSVSRFLTTCRPLPAVILGFCFCNLGPEAIFIRANTKMVSLAKADWNAAYRSISFGRLLGNACRATASTLTQSDWNGRLRLHGESPFVVSLCRARGCSNTALAFL